MTNLIDHLLVNGIIILFYGCQLSGFQR